MLDALRPLAESDAPLFARLRSLAEEFRFQQLWQLLHKNHSGAEHESTKS